MSTDAPLPATTIVVPGKKPEDPKSQKAWRADIWKETNHVVTVTKGYKLLSTSAGGNSEEFREVDISGCQEKVKKYKNAEQAAAACGSSSSSGDSEGGKEKFFSQTIVRVENADCVEGTIRLIETTSADGGPHSPMLMDAASRDHFGGGYKNGARAQEEELCRRSALANVVHPLEKDLFPLAPESGVYCPPIPFFREGDGKDYALSEKVHRIAVGLVAAYNRPRLVENHTRLAEEETQGTREMIQTFFHMALAHGHDSVVCVPLGCGAFKNPALHVAEIFMQEILSSTFKGRFRSIVFSVLDDHNAYHEHNPFGNYSAFGMQALKLLAGGASAATSAGGGSTEATKDEKKQEVPPPSAGAAVVGTIVGQVIERVIKKEEGGGGASLEKEEKENSTTPAVSAKKVVLVVQVFGPNGEAMTLESLEKHAEYMKSQVPTGEGNNQHLSHHSHEKKDRILPVCPALLAGAASQPHGVPSDHSCHELKTYSHTKSYRHKCKYWERCSRLRDDDHTGHFLHPCKFGSGCYRGNADHQERFFHPKKSGGATRDLDLGSQPEENETENGNE